MSKEKRTSLSVTVERKLKLERLAIEISFKTGKQVAWTDIANYMFDKMATQAKNEMVEEFSDD